MTNQPHPCDQQPHADSVSVSHFVWGLVVLFTLSACYYWFGSKLLMWLGVTDTPLVCMYLGIVATAVLAGLYFVAVAIDNSTRIPIEKSGANPLVYEAGQLSPYAGKIKGSPQPGDTLYWYRGYLYDKAGVEAAQAMDAETERIAKKDVQSYVTEVAERTDKKPYDDDLNDADAYCLTCAAALSSSDDNGFLHCFNCLYKEYEKQRRADSLIIKGPVVPDGETVQCSTAWDTEETWPAEGQEHLPAKGLL